MKKQFPLLGAALIGIGLLMLFLGMAKSTLAANSQAMFIVNSSIDAVDANPGDGVCETGTGNGICTLRAAIMEANNLGGADTIMLPAGNYTLIIPGSDDVSAVGDLDILESLEIIGEGLETTIIDGNSIDRIFHIEPPAGSQTISITGITLQNGNGSSGGGLCNCSPVSHVLLSSTAVISNYAPNLGAGGIRNLGQMTIIDTIIASNTANFTGGGLANEANATMVISQSTIAQNIADFDGLGGGIANIGILTVTQSTIWDNEALSAGIGSVGGGIYNSGQMWLENSTVGENTALSAGGGVWSNVYMIVTHSTIYSNTTINAIINGNANNIFVLGGIVKLHATIVAGFDGTNCTGTLISNGYNLEGGNSCGFTSTGDITNTNPLLGPLQDNGGPTLTFALLEGSPAIDTADNLNCPATDQRGVPRPFDGDGDNDAVCDIGSFELGESTFIVYLPVILKP